MSRERIRFGIVGAGAISQSYAQAFAASGRAELVAVADSRIEAARAFGERIGCPSFDSHQAMADAVAFDAAVVCTPPASHPEITIALVDRGKHVLCEKPLSIGIEAAHAMTNAARRAGVLLTMASKFRYVEDVIRARSLVGAGLVGDIVLFENAFTSRVDMSARWNSRPELSGGGVLIDNGTHSVDLMRYFLGPLDEVHAVEGKRSQGLSVEDTARIFVRSMRGVLGSIDLSWSINKELASYINIYGSRATISVGWKESKYREAASPEWVVFGKGYDKVQAFRAQIDNFAAAIRGEEALVITAEDGIASVEVIATAYDSLRRNYWMQVAKPVERASVPA